MLSKQADALLGYFMDQGPRMQLQTGVKMGWTRLYDMAGVTTLSSAIIVNNDWLKDAEEPGPAAPLPARLAARLAVQLRQPRRGRRNLPQARAGVQQGDRAARDRRHDDASSAPSTPRASRSPGRRRGTGRTARSCWRNTPSCTAQPDMGMYFTNELSLRSRRTCRRSRVALRGAAERLRRTSEPACGNVGKVYETKDGPSRPARRSISTSGESEFVAIVGPSGCGKTTILKMVAGLRAVYLGQRSPSAASASTGRRPMSASCSRRRSCSTGATCSRT